MGTAWAISFYGCGVVQETSQEKTQKALQMMAGETAVGMNRLGAAFDKSVARKPEIVGEYHRVFGTLTPEEWDRLVTKWILVGQNFPRIVDLRQLAYEEGIFSRERRTFGPSSTLTVECVCGYTWAHHKPDLTGLGPNYGFQCEKCGRFYKASIILLNQVKDHYAATESDAVVLPLKGQ